MILSMAEYLLSQRKVSSHLPDMGSISESLPVRDDRGQWARLLMTQHLGAFQLFHRQRLMKGR